MRDGDNSLWPISEFGVQNYDWHDYDKSNKSSCQNIDHHGFSEHLIRVLRAKIDHTVKCMGAIKLGIRQVRNPFGIGNTRQGAKSKQTAD